MDPSSTPLPVIPLAYQDPSDDPLQSLVAVARGVAWVIVMRDALALTAYAFQIGCYAWQQATAVGAARQLIPGPPLVIYVPAEIVAAVSLVAGGRCLQLREQGRVWLVRAAAAQAVVWPISAFADVIYYLVARGYARYGVPFAASTLLPHLSAAIFEPILAAAIWLFYRQRTVRRLFRPA